MIQLQPAGLPPYIDYITPPGSSTLMPFYNNFIVPISEFDTKIRAKNFQVITKILSDQGYEFDMVGYSTFTPYTKARCDKLVKFGKGKKPVIHFCAIVGSLEKPLLIWRVTVHPKVRNYIYIGGYKFRFGTFEQLDELKRTLLFA